mmetsp:Transcript_2206/g.4457  ORF Transcript_2206/g.4457 Transcript_2206/m.4457 type:complete len:227 (+) Transcript_2206:1995-2675(+)
MASMRGALGVGRRRHCTCATNCSFQVLNHILSLALVTRFCFNATTEFFHQESVHLAINEAPIFGPVQKLAHFCLNAPVISRTMQHKCRILLALNAKGAFVLSPRFSINLNRNLLFYHDFNVATLSNSLGISNSNFALSQMNQPSDRNYIQVPILARRLPVAGRHFLKQFFVGQFSHQIIRAVHAVNRLLAIQEHTGTHALRATNSRSMARRAMTHTIGPQRDTTSV